jgi:hypothetical protein
MIEDTTKRAPGAHITGILTEGQSAYIEGMEREGGRQLQASSLLPVKGSDDPRLAMIGWGPVVDADPLFREATLPEGWTKAAGDSPYGYWTTILDEHGRERAEVFYKAAFYDRRAHIMALDVE